MPVDCQRSTSGGKGNWGMFIERNPRMCAAGLPSAQPDDRVADSLQHYLPKDHVDAIIGDAIIPPSKPKPPPPLRHPRKRDQRFSGLFGDVAQIVNPPIRTKFQTLVDDLKETAYKSYWTEPVGKVRDPVPMSPEGFDLATNFGKKTAFHGRLYDLVMPKEPVCDKTPAGKQPRQQMKRHYCSPPYNGDVTFGHRTFLDKRGTYARCCLTDDRIVMGTAAKTFRNTIHSNHIEFNQPTVGTVLAPNENIGKVPRGFSFGKLKPPSNMSACLMSCDINPYRDRIKKSLKHLNTLRKCMSSRYLPTFFHKFYLSLKYLDKDKSGWLPKAAIYSMCAENRIRVQDDLIEPLLSLWQAFDGSRIAYKTFVHVLNYKERSPNIPKILDLPQDCLKFETTYREMTKPGQESDNSRMALVPSGRYFDLDYPVTPERCCKADRTCLPHESDMKSCLNPSILTLFNVNHRDMYGTREPDVVRRVFEGAGIKLDDEEFHAVWDDARKYHSQGSVCFETFRRALKSRNDGNQNNSKTKH